MQKIIVEDLGLIDFGKAWDYQESILQELVKLKQAERNIPVTERTPVNHRLLFCEHPHVYTLGKSGKENHLLINEKFLQKINATYFRINRGGDITYHGPGQIVMYPILDLDFFFNDVHRYMRSLEEVVIRTLADYEITASRIQGLTGVWIDAGTPHARKICAFGVRLSRWITMHGLAFNINTGLSYFNHIVPCGITDKAVTSLQKELGKEISMAEVKEKMIRHFADVFRTEIVPAVATAEL
jgi:lipoyl(octanoyl) transferase